MPQLNEYSWSIHSINLLFMMFLVIIFMSSLDLHRSFFYCSLSKAKCPVFFW